MISLIVYTVYFQYIILGLLSCFKLKKLFNLIWKILMHLNRNFKKHISKPYSKVDFLTILPLL